ncbi:phosphoglycolate phosphatase [Bacillus thuringiensis]|uniref:Phosphoglycolate phosphatase n=1 Tax=Bacillus thuringiensis TaxID=1428 RepID=A0A9X6Y746_BACTU|nr:phosphoglycolate phosphatase [Bacillus thuringiensis]PEA85877.1 phosphoglycolate phosphatase [Bacillus thuringiensis]
MKRNLLRYGVVFFAFLIVPPLFMYIGMNRFTPKEFLEEEWPKTKITAELVTIGYFKKEKNLDVVIDKMTFSTDFFIHEIYINGHIAGNEQQKISATVNSGEKYTVEDTSKIKLKPKSS